MKRIFSWRADDGLVFAAIAVRLNSDPRQYPPPVPGGRWTAKAVQSPAVRLRRAVGHFGAEGARAAG